jgi:hypothetical protein
VQNETTVRGGEVTTDKRHRKREKRGIGKGGEARERECMEMLEISEPLL